MEIKFAILKILETVCNQHFGLLLGASTIYILDYLGPSTIYILDY